MNYALTRFTASQAKTQTYGKSWFGLYLVHFNGGTDVMPWFYRVSSICGASADLLAAQATQPIVSLWNNVCGVNCVGHFKTRCAAYKQVATIGYVTLAALIGGSCLAITASAWVFVFGKSRQFHRFSWFFAGAIALVLVSILFYSWIVFTNALSTLSWWPPWNTGPSLWTAVAGATLEICAAATVYGATVYERSQARKAVRITRRSNDQLLRTHAERATSSTESLGRGRRIRGWELCPAVNGRTLTSFVGARKCSVTKSAVLSLLRDLHGCLSMSTYCTLANIVYPPLLPPNIMLHARLGMCRSSTECA